MEPIMQIWYKYSKWKMAHKFAKRTSIPPGGNHWIHAQKIDLTPALLHLLRSELRVSVLTLLQSYTILYIDFQNIHESHENWDNVRQLKVKIVKSILQNIISTTPLPPGEIRDNEYSDKIKGRKSECRVVGPTTAQVCGPRIHCPVIAVEQKLDSTVLQLSWIECWQLSCQQQHQQHYL